MAQAIVTAVGEGVGESEAEAVTITVEDTVLDRDAEELPLGDVVLETASLALAEAVAMVAVGEMDSVGLGEVLAANDADCDELAATLAVSEEAGDGLGVKLTATDED